MLDREAKKKQTQKHKERGKEEGWDDRKNFIYVTVINCTYTKLIQNMLISKENRTFQLKEECFMQDDPVLLVICFPSLTLGNKAYILMNILNLLSMLCYVVREVNVVQKTSFIIEESMTASMKVGHCHMLEE